MPTLSLATAENALKSFYLDVVAHQLNTETNPFYRKIEQTENFVNGKEVKKAVAYGVNGGISAGTETGDLPAAYANEYAQFTGRLKNLYGQLEISDKAIRASENSSGAFVNLLNAEMEGLLRAAKFNLGRMLFGDGSGKLASLAAAASNTATVTVQSGKNLVGGMVVDIYATMADTSPAQQGVRIAAVNGETVTLSRAVTAPNGACLVMQGSKGNELSGLGAIFSETDLYGLSRTQNPWMAPYTVSSVGAITDAKIQKAIDTVEERAGSKIDFLLCSYGVRRAYAAYLETNKRNVSPVELEGGYKTISFAGIPLVADRFAPAGSMYLLDSSDFALHQLCDWRFLEGENGNVLRQVPGKAVYNATLVKYAELMCHRPGGQALLTGITES